jgi:hypothetical protein
MEEPRKVAAIRKMHEEDGARARQDIQVGYENEGSIRKDRRQDVKEGRQWEINE